MSDPVYTVADIRDLERRALATDPDPSLMARAGLAAAERARTLLGNRGGSVLILVGPGNNGGDALEVAVHLKRWFFRVSVLFAGDPAQLSGDAGAALEKWRAVDGRLLLDIPPREHFDLAVDGLFGIGLARPLEGRMAELVSSLNGLTCPVLALDIPSGLHAETGVALGATIRATHTVTFIALKPGLLTLDGPDHCGVLEVNTLGLDVERLLAPRGRRVDAGALGALPRTRPSNFHKGLAGNLAVIGGAQGMLGAALLAGRAALKSGAGKVFLGLIADEAAAVDWAQPELMLRTAESLFTDVSIDVYAVGPGMGQDAVAQRLLAQALRSDKPVVLDADALNLVAGYSVLQKALASRKAASVLTPHPAEAGRLLGSNVKAVQSDRLAAARALARKFASHVVLKGNGSIVAAPDGRFWINGSGNPGMASAGMGDVLTGIVASLLAQGASAADALIAGVWLHGAAADELVARGVGPIGLAAGELADTARTLLNRRSA